MRHQAIRAGILLLAVMLLCGIRVSATELGAPEIRSYLGEPLQARIALENVDVASVAAAKISLAPPLEWARQGAGIFPEDLQLDVAIEQDDDGYFVALNSDQPVNEPVLQLLLDLQLPQRALVSKPYVLFLDPKPGPGDLARRSLAMRRSARLAAASDTAAESEPVAEAEAVNPTASNDRPAPVRQPRGNNDDNYGPVQSGETLWGIAQRYATSTPMTAQQWLVALQNANPQALQDPDNVNTLRSGAMLDIPDARSVAGISHYDAVIRLRAQNMAWSNSGGRLHLLNASDGSERSTVNDSVAALRIARLQEELLSVKRENAALREQVELLNTEIDQRDEEISVLQADLASNAAAAAAGVPALDYSLHDGADDGSSPDTDDHAAGVNAGPLSTEMDGEQGARSNAQSNNDDTQAGRADSMNLETTQVATGSTTKAALAAQLPETGDAWFQQIAWLPDSLSGLILFAAMLLLLLAALFWALRSMFSRSSDDSEYQNMLNALNRQRQQPNADQADTDQADAAVLTSDNERLAESLQQGKPEASEDVQAAAQQADNKANLEDEPSTAWSAAEHALEQQEPQADAATAATAESAAAESASDDDAIGADGIDPDTGENDPTDDDDWRDQINAIMDEVDEDADDSAAQQLSATHGSDDMALAMDSGNTGQQADEDSASDDKHDHELLAPLKYETAAEHDAGPEAAETSELADDDAEPPAGSDPAATDAAITAPLAFTTDDSNAVANRNQDADEQEADTEHASSPVTPTSQDDRMPPLSFDAFDDAAEDDADQAQHTSTGQQHEAEAVDADDMTSNFDPFVESIRESLSPADDDWLQDASADDLQASGDSSSGEQIQPQEVAPETAPEVAPASTEPGERSAAGQHLSTNVDDDAASALSQPESEAEDDDVFDSIEIKLDLARAYLAMGDQQAMRILLDEIGDQGTAAQREEMASLLQQTQS